MGTRMIPTSFLRIPQWPEPDSDELLLAVEGSALEDEFLSYMFIFLIPCNSSTQCNETGIIVPYLTIFNFPVECLSLEYWKS
ncbi:hypothetical protein DCAR_0521533 [Daucus carota subsp. sativus]|uniref:Uncharacterized protein n=1 Tax=Daucus carota subsp. sativus TaxID=79200 RepID=A0AAF0X621_DAUCS|nr:hypothetical protein DCAR_0521533 [Daucus carota subsp. sativus]